MRALVAPGEETITPFVDRVQELWLNHEISTVVVVGASGAWFDVVDCVIRVRTRPMV